VKPADRDESRVRPGIVRFVATSSYCGGATTRFPPPLFSVGFWPLDFSPSDGVSPGGETLEEEPPHPTIVANARMSTRYFAIE